MDWVEAHDMTSAEFEQKNSEIGNRLAHVAGYCVGDVVSEGESEKREERNRPGVALEVVERF
jgi:hypothetical protein